MLEHLRYVSTADGAVVLNIQNGIMFSMNPVASNMFEAVIKGCGEDQIVADITNLYQVEKERVQADFTVLIADLKAKGILPEGAT